MKILILAAMDKELNLLLNILKNPKESKKGSQSIWEGEIEEHKVVISKCGIGKVNAALNTLQMISNYNPDLVINSGVAGGAGIPIGTVLIADKVAYHDVWCGPGTVYGQADGFPVFMEPWKEILKFQEVDSDIQTGLICSGDKFISTPEEIAFIRSKFPDVKAVDMESAAVAQTCLQCGIKFAIIRIVSDTPGEGENIEQYKDFWSKAPDKTFSVLKLILRGLK